MLWSASSAEGPSNVHKPEHLKQAGSKVKSVPLTDAHLYLRTGVRQTVVRVRPCGGTALLEIAQLLDSLTNEVVDADEGAEF